MTGLASFGVPRLGVLMRALSRLEEGLPARQYSVSAEAPHQRRADLRSTVSSVRVAAYISRNDRSRRAGAPLSGALGGIPDGALIGSVRRGAAAILAEGGLG